MKTTGLLLSLAVAGGLLLLAACGLDPVQPDQDVVLKPGEGVAVVMTDTLDALDNLLIQSADDPRVPSITISRVMPGVRMWVYAVPAGSYCVVSFRYAGRIKFYATDPKHDFCFDVVPGKVSYSGNIGPRVRSGSVYVDQDYDWPGFGKMFKEQYPKLASYPIVAP